MEKPIKTTNFPNVPSIFPEENEDKEGGTNE